MDVLSLEHNFGKEIETSIQQLFNYFCNNLNLGQWQAAKACLKQLIIFKKNFQFDLQQVLDDIVQNPQLYCSGSQTIQSPYHLSLLLYDFCNQNIDEQFYDKILFKFLIYSISTSEDNNSVKSFIEELSNFSQLNQLTTETSDYLKNLFLTKPFKCEHLLRIIFKYNPSSEHTFLKVHLTSVNNCLESLNSMSSIELLCNLLTILSMYEFKPINIELENSKHESLALIQRCFKDLCIKFNTLWSDDLVKLEDNYRLIYSCFLDQTETKIDLLDLFCTINYQVERMQTITSTFNDETLPILSIIKKYSGIPKKESYLWHRLFLYCYIEKKLILKSLIDECLILVSRSQFDNLVLMLSVKEFLNVKPLILLIGISKVQDLHSAKRLISALCLNTDKGSLIDKIGNLLKTHLDFIAWFLSLKKENRKKDINFSDLIKLLHKKLPLNIISHYIDINTLNNSQMTKILRNTLTDTETGEKTKWVRFVDEVNEKISLVQGNCLAIYDGFFCITEIINSIVYCCESINHKLSLMVNDNSIEDDLHKYKRSSTSTYLSFKAAQQDNKSVKSLTSFYDLENDYKKIVIEKFEIVRQILANIQPMNYRLELLENIYSLIYLSFNDLKEADESDDDQDELTAQISSDINGELKNENGDTTNQTVYIHEDSEFSIYGKNESNTTIKEEIAYSSKSYTKQDSCCSNASSNQSNKKYTNIVYYESNDDEEKSRNKKFINIDRRNAGGGGSFLVNDFMCRDILLLVKDLLQQFQSVNKSNKTDSEASTLLNCSILTAQDLQKRSSKLQHLVNETLWRLQLVKCEQFQIEYGRFNCILYDVNSSAAINEVQETIIYELMKTRKRNASSVSSVGSSSRSKTTRNRVKTITSIVSKDDNRRSFESQRSLSLITPSTRNRHSNQTIMKLLASVETLSSLCLKESKITEANQLIKMYASNKEACESFEFRQIVFNSMFNKVVEDLHDLDSKSRTNSLIENSLKSLDLVKLTDSFLSIENDNPMLQCLFLCDIISTTKFSLKLSTDLADYARIKLNSIESNDKFDSEMKNKLFLFIEGCQSISNHLSDKPKCLIDYLTRFDGIYLDVNESAVNIETNISKFQNYNQLSADLDAWKTKFENFYTTNEVNTNQQTEIYFSIMNTINELIRINKNEDIISTFFYDAQQFNKQVNESELNTIEKLIYKTVNSDQKQTNHKCSSNYLLSFYEYCKTLYEYFKENSTLSSSTINTCFSILNSSPASLICKLLFEDSIKPHLIESLTKKLNLNLTAIILHNSCPRLKLNSSQRGAIKQRENKLEHFLNNVTSNESNFYSLNSFYTILNENELSYCSKKKPDQFLRDLLFKLLKYCKNFNVTQQEDTNEIKNMSKRSNERLIDLAAAKKIYESAEFKSILNESQELQHLNLNFLETDYQRLSFFINLYNLLCIHAHFYFTSFVSPSADLDGLFPDDMFMNKTEKLLFQQRMCYKVGQMGCVTLYDLKHLVLMRSFYKKFNAPNSAIYAIKKKVSSNPSTLANSPVSKSTLSNSTNLNHIDLSADNAEPLYKYSYFKLDLDAEPLWTRNYLPSEDICDYRILFALTNCSESDPPICVYDSDEMLQDQLQMQMSLFLDDSINVDLCEDCLYLPSFLIENYTLFIKNESNSRKTDLENLIRFLIENTSGETKENLKALLELEPEGFGGENIDEFGRRELTFPIEKIFKSSKFSLVIDYNDQWHKSSTSWFKTEIQRILKVNEEEKLRKNRDRAKLVRSVSQTSDLPSESLKVGSDNEDIDVRMDDLTQNISTQQKLNKDCLDYISQTSPLISNSLSFLFDINKRDEFFKSLNDNEKNDNSLNRFIHLYVPLDYMSHLTMQTKLNLITQFLLTNKTEESKIELIIDLANHYAMKQEWNLVFSLLNNCTQDNEELNDITDHRKHSISKHSGTIITNEFEFEPSLDSQATDKENTLNTSDNSRYSRKDLYNLYDQACICQAYQEAKTNEKSFIHLFRIKNFLKQIRAIFGLMHLWSVESCLELIDYCLAKSKLSQEPDNSFEMETSSQILDKMIGPDFNMTDHLISILNEKKNELTAYQELTKYARTTLQKYYEHQQMQDAAGFYEQTKSDQMEESSLAKMKKCCQKCLTWQFAKKQLESTSSDEETNDLIMDLFLMNDHFTSAKYLIQKLNLSDKLKFKLDFGHLKYRLLNLNVSSSIIVIDLDTILHECITFDKDNKDYMFEICFRLLNELKELKELNNQVLISLSEYLLENYRLKLTKQQTKELKTLQVTARIFQILVQELKESFDSYKRHHSNPILIIEQLLMNSHIELCSRAIRICRDNSLNETSLNTAINQILVQYAKKALEFKVFTRKQSNARNENTKSRSPQGIKIKNRSKVSNETIKSSSITIPLSTSSPNNSNISASVKNTNRLNNDLLSSSFSTNSSSSYRSGFVMPDLPPPKEEWVKDDDVSECMVCNTRRFSLLNRRHHCRRCGRVVCSNCAKNMTLIGNIPKRTCDDCFKQIEEQKLNEKSLSSLETDPIAWSKKLIRNSSKPKASLKSSEHEQEVTSLSDDTNETILVWQLMGCNENETSKRRDDEIRHSFRYQQAPSTSLCLSILDLHDQPLECVKDLLNMCDNLSSFLQTANYQVEDFALIINMIKHLLHNAKVKLLQNSSSNMITLCDTYLSLIDVLEQLLLDNCSNIPSLYELKNTESVRRFRNRLLEEERHELAMNISTKCGLDSQTVWASWGLTELRRGNYKEARNKYEKCMKPINDRLASIGSAQLKILNDTVNYLENSPPIRKIGPQSLLNPLQSVKALIAEPKFNQTNGCLDDNQLNECIYYLETYGNYSMVASFYQRHGYLEKALHFVIESKSSTDVFIESLLVPTLKTGEFYQLIDQMLSLDRIQNKLIQYYGSIGKYLEKNSFLNTLYDFQILMKDYVRASMSCICFFTRHCTNYSDLYNNLNYLNKARKHLEEYLELCSIKQYLQTSQQQIISKQNSLCKQITTQEVDNYLNAINLQIEVTKFINNCIAQKKDQIVNQKATCTVFGSNDTKINLCCSILLSGQSIQEGFGFVIRIIQCFNLNATLVYAQIARELAKQYNFKEIHNLLKCINESGYKEEVNASYDECISTCIRVFAADNNNKTPSSNLSAQAQQQQEQQQQQYSKEIEELIKLMKNDENRINAYILNGRLRSAYLIAIKLERVDIVKHIANAADRAGQNLIKDICNKWLEKKQSQ